MMLLSAEIALEFAELVAMIVCVAAVTALLYSVVAFAEYHYSKQQLRLEIAELSLPRVNHLAFATLLDLHFGVGFVDFVMLLEWLVVAVQVLLLPLP